VALPEVRVTVHAAELLEVAGERVTFRVTVSTGTYVRALARDLGERLGVGAHLAELRREAIGALHVGQALPLDRLGPDTPLLPLARVLQHLPSLALTDDELADVRQGRAMMDRWSDGPIDCEAVVLLAEGEVVGVGRLDRGWVRPQVVLAGA
jgi:tRNA pseudouridine55 synthase